MGQQVDILTNQLAENFYQFQHKTKGDRIRLSDYSYTLKNQLPILNPNPFLIIS